MTMGRQVYLYEHDKEYKKYMKYRIYPGFRLCKGPFEELKKFELFK